MERQWLYTVNPSDPEPKMLINQPIGNSKDEDGNIVNGIDGAAFQNELMFLDTLGKKRIKVLINSPGGSVMEGYNIFHAIISAKTPVDTYNIGLAASIAGVIFQGGNERFISDYANTMVHPPAGGDVKMLKSIYDSLQTMITSRNRKNLDPDKLKGYMDKETWFNAEESVKNGLADKIENSEDMNVPQVAGEEVMNCYKRVQGIVNTYIDTNKPKIKMKTVTNSLKLNDGADEASVLAAITKIKNEVTDTANKLKEAEDALNACKAEYEDKMKDLNDKFTKMKNEVEDAKKVQEVANAKVLEDKAVAEVDNFVKVGKLKAETKTEWVNKFVADFDGMKKLVDSLPLNKPGKKLEEPGGQGQAGVYKIGASMIDIAVKNKQTTF